MVTPTLGTFDSAWLKWHRAVTQATALNEEVERFTRESRGNPSIVLTTDYNAQRHAFVVSVAWVREFPPDWGLRFGEIVFNYRCALDHLAWALVGRGQMPPLTLTENQRRGIAFPITDKGRRADFNAALGRRLPGISRTDLAVLRRHQPYRRDQRIPWRLHPLCLLAGFNNHDKHRYLAPLWGVPTGAKFKIPVWTDCIVTDRRKSLSPGPLQVGAEVRTVRVRKTGPNPKMEVQADFTAHVAVGEGTPITRLFNAVQVSIADILTAFSPPPRRLFAAMK